MVKKATVSIVIPVYNGADYLRESIDSALNQTYPHIEILVVNDGSDDEGMTEAIALSYGSKIRYFFKENAGVASALNLGIKEMKGVYFSWLSHDDVYYPHKIASQMEFLGLAPDEVILYSDYDIINEKSELIGSNRLKQIEADCFRFSLTVSHPVHGCTTLIPRTCFERCGYFDESLRTTQDYDFWFRLAGLFTFIHVPGALIQSRHHVKQGTQTMVITHYREVNELLGSYLEKLTETEITSCTCESLSLSYGRIAENFVSRKLYPVACKAMRRALRYFLQQNLSSQIQTTVVLVIQSLKMLRVLLFRVFRLG